jgi:hypothetical protein
MSVCLCYSFLYIRLSIDCSSGHASNKMWLLLVEESKCFWVTITDQLTNISEDLMNYSSKLWLVYWAFFWVSKLRTWWSMSKILAFHTEVRMFEASQMHCRFFFIPHQRQAQNFVDYKVACTGSHIKLKVCCAWYRLHLHCHPQWQQWSSTHWELNVLALLTQTEAKVVKSCTDIRLCTSFFFFVWIIFMFLIRYFFSWWKC